MNDSGGDGWWGTRDERDPPVPVRVDLRRVFPPRRVGGGGRGVPLRVRAAAIDNSSTVDGVLLAWHLVATGERWAHLRVELTNRNRRGRLVTELWAPENAVHRRVP